jgi:uncharacterized protein
MSSKSRNAVDIPTEQGLHMREAHFPGRVAIDAYGDGGFRFGGMSHRGSILCLPSGVYGWNVSVTADLNVSNFRSVFAESTDIEVLLIGSGLDLEPINLPLRKAFRASAISADPMSTGAAVRTYNVLLAEGRAVAVALLAVA